MKKNVCFPSLPLQTALAASCLSCPSDPVQFLKNTLVVFQGHDNLQNVDWYVDAKAIHFTHNEHLGSHFYIFYFMALVMVVVGNHVIHLISP